MQSFIVAQIKPASIFLSGGLTVIVSVWVMLVLTVTVVPAETSSFIHPGTVLVGDLPQSATVLPALSAGSNVGIVGDAPPDRQQVEPTIAIDPRNPSIIVAGAQDLRLVSVGEHRWHGFYRSTDGGQTWTSMLLPGYPGDLSAQGLASPVRGFNATSDPVLAFDRNGNLYYVGLVLNITRGGFIPNTGLFVAKFTNDGGTYFSTTLISAGIFPDKPWIAVDTTGGPFDGNVYVAYDANLTATSFFGTLFTRSIDGGQTWSAPFYAPADETGELPGMAIDASGNVYVSDDAFDPVSEAFLGYVEVTKITNGGTTIAETTRAVSPASIIPSPLPGGSFRAFTIPQMAADQNGVYLVWDDFRTGNANVFFTRSTDGGTTWIAPLMVNDVTTGQHFFPTIAASGGIISVAWYDSRLNTGTTMTSLDVFYSQSLNAGSTFSPNIRVTSVSFNPNIVLRTDPPGANFPFMGDYIGIAATQTTAQPIWSDNRNACDTVDPTYGCVDQDVFTATVSKADFTIYASPTSLTIARKASGSFTITVQSFGGFTGTVSLSASITPTKKSPTLSSISSVAISPSSPTGTTSLTVTTAGSTVSGTYTIIITGISSSTTHSVVVTVTVTK